MTDTYTVNQLCNAIAAILQAQTICTLNKEEVDTEGLKTAILVLQDKIKEVTVNG